MPTNHNLPVVYGTGLIALDVVYGLTESAPKYQVGGTCGNVLSALAFLGWDSYPISRLQNDSAGEIVRSDLRRCGVHTDFVGLAPTGPTPIIVEQIVRTKRGVPTHRFHLTCPNCGGFYPSFKPLRNDTVRALLSRSIKVPRVFFADRVSKGIVELAKYFEKRGALIYFEPSGIGQVKQFREMARLSHVLKYSQERASNFLEVLHGAKPLLQIETLGEDGIRCCSNLPKASTKGWMKVDGIDTAEFKDAAGSGDWATSAIIDCLGRKGLQGLLRTNKDQLLNAIRYAQVLATWNCCYEGARGGMYQGNWSSLQKYIQSASLKTKPLVVRSEKISAVAGAMGLCRSCDTDGWPMKSGRDQAAQRVVKTA